MKVALIASIAVALPLWGQGQGLHDATQIGPAAGSIAAGFSLFDQSGRRHTLESLMEPRGLVLVFFRSADW